LLAVRPEVLYREQLLPMLGRHEEQFFLDTWSRRLKEILDGFFE
jgi:hypothetical protein